QITYENSKSIEKSGEIIFVYGTSNAGKSSICKSLKEVKPDWVFENADDIFEDTLRYVLQEEHPEYFEIIKKAINEKNIFTSSTFLRGVYSFKASSTKQEQMEAIQVIKKIQQEHPLLKISKAWENAELELFRRGFEQAAKGKTVVLDSVCPELLLKYKKENNLAIPVRLVCVVCPFLKLAKRLIQRNLDAENKDDLKEARYGFFPLANWTKLYTAQTSANEVVVDCVDKQAVVEAIKTVKEFVSKRKDPNLSLKREDDASVEDIDGFIRTMGFSETTSKVSFVPRFSFDQLIITDRQTPLSSAKEIASWQKQ
ncbi:MAG: AAA family ATPase, partial [Proteobacteria bacterium]|nr:AAA family ATPase [Pseudomonadota bacterium]